MQDLYMLTGSLSGIGGSTGAGLPYASIISSCFLAHTRLEELCNAESLEMEGQRQHTQWPTYDAFFWSNWFEMDN